MFWFVIVVLGSIVCAGILGFGLGVKLLKFGEDRSQQKRTLRIVVVSFVELLAGGFALVAVATKIVEPLVALVVTLITILIALLGFRTSDK